MTLHGLGEVGVTGGDVGHVGGVIPGNGNSAPQGREAAERRRRWLYSAQNGQAQPLCSGKDCLSRHVDFGLDWGQKRKNGHLQRLLL